MDGESFQRLHAATLRSLWGYIFSSTGSPTLADDLSQEAYLRMLTAQLPESATDAYLRHYLFRVASNLISDNRREARRTGNMPVSEASIPSHDDPLIERQRIRQALSSLRAKDRQLLWLAFVEKLSHREIAQQLSFREPSIRPLLHRAKCRLLEYLKGDKNAV